MISRLRQGWWMYDMAGLRWYILRPGRVWRDRRGIAASLLDLAEHVWPQVSRLTGRWLQP